MIHYILTLWLSLGMMNYPNSELSVSVKGIQTVKGKIYMAVYNRAEGFLEVETAIATQITPVTGKQVVIRFRNLKPGYYAIATYHDKNSDGKMNKNLVGVPTEYYGFSRDARARFRAPSFEAARFYYKGGNATTVIHLK
ncbi:DUF2141 domain-containing protein [uncultured Microscilla sp.]|uniref:DUF2141 domain-containing protein n=1 Tax=uncultured Microscilla sp. TaxID=432653 RepID=UPI002635FF8C|nr:DUF2141 domain-containing protein [uncultured Microscilla sp.]